MVWRGVSGAPGTGTGTPVLSEGASTGSAASTLSNGTVTGTDPAATAGAPVAAEATQATTAASEPRVVNFITVFRPLGSYPDRVRPVACNNEHTPRTRADFPCPQQSADRC
ncbi:hypothetical protein GCM10023329_21500 [Streptomyces sanyensis]|uniref:Uncharacterized protein n=1 Tax=Streptomyces sanyensis TaxID=568869 RepID=A0ABP9A3N6_9ACTN